MECRILCKARFKVASSWTSQGRRQTLCLASFIGPRSCCNDSVKVEIRSLLKGHSSLPSLNFFYLQLPSILLSTNMAPVKGLADSPPLKTQEEMAKGYTYYSGFACDPVAVGKGFESLPHLKGQIGVSLPKFPFLS